MEINFGTNVTNCSIIFDVNGNYGIQNNNIWIHGKNWNGQVAFPNGATKVSLEDSTNMNKKVQIPYSVTNVNEAFFQCRLFNQNVQLPNNINDMNGAFQTCPLLNQNIQIPNNVTNMQSTFETCLNLNQNIQIPNGVTSLSEVFANCTKFNQNTHIPNTVLHMENAFAVCRGLNQNIQIPNSVTRIANTFRLCVNLNQNIKIPASVVDIRMAFYNCNNLSDITIVPQNRDLVNMVSFVRANNAKSLNIWTDATTAVNIMNANFVVGNVKPTMEAITNGYYNAQYNVYIYTNTVFD